MNTKTKRLPDFLVIGAGKSGTTSLHHYLAQHPDIFMARKEPSYFAIKHLEIINDPSDKEMMNYYPNGVHTLDKYYDLFADAQVGQKIGEISPIYLNSEMAAKEIKSTIPDAKLIAILRHPAERLFSRYLHLASEDRAPELDLIFDKESLWHTRNDLVKEGYYGKNLSMYLELFKSNNLKVVLYDDYRKDPNGVIASIYDFIGVDHAFQTDISIKHNQSGFAKNKVLNKLLGKKGLANTIVKSISPAIYQKLKSNPIVYKSLTNLRNKNTYKPKLSLELKKDITERLYLDDIKKLEEILKRDLKSWLTI